MDKTRLRLFVFQTILFLLFIIVFFVPIFSCAKINLNMSLYIILTNELRDLITLNYHYTPYILMFAFYFCSLAAAILNFTMTLLNKKSFKFIEIILQIVTLVFIIVFKVSYESFTNSIIIGTEQISLSPHVGFYLFILLCILTGLYYAATHPIRRAKAYIGNVREKLAAKRAEREASHPLTDKERIEQLEQQVKKLSEKVKKE